MPGHPELTAGGRLQGNAGINVNLGGAESAITLSQANLVAPAGSINLFSGSPTSIISYATGQVQAGGTVTVRASLAGNTGEVNFESVRITAGGNVLFQSGPSGTTSVKNNTISSPTSVRALAAVSGSCVAEGNLVTAPVIQLCN